MSPFWNTLLALLDPDPPKTNKGSGFEKQFFLYVQLLLFVLNKFLYIKYGKARCEEGSRAGVPHRWESHLRTLPSGWGERLFISALYCFFICKNMLSSGSKFCSWIVAVYFQSYLYNSVLIRVTRRQGCIELCCRPYSTKLLHRGTTLNKNTSGDDI